MGALPKAIDVVGRRKDFDDRSELKRAYDIDSQISRLSIHRALDLDRADIAQSPPSIHRLDVSGLRESHRGSKIVFNEFCEDLDAHLLWLDAEISQSLLYDWVP